jgi:heavy metal translocating P-type ATPase
MPSRHEPLPRGGVEPTKGAAANRGTGLETFDGDTHDRNPTPGPASRGAPTTQSSDPDTAAAKAGIWIRAREVVWTHRQVLTAVLALVAITVHLVLRLGFRTAPGVYHAPLFVAFLAGGSMQVAELLAKAVRREFGSDLLAGISIVTSVLLGEYLAGVFVILMLSGGETLEVYAVRSASSVLRALAARFPLIAHRRIDARIEDVAVAAVRVGDVVVILPHEVSPVDGTVIEGHGVMDESYLTGEPYTISKTPGTSVISGAINGENVLTVRADRIASNSRYARIVEVMKETQTARPRIRRLGDRLGAYYTPIAVAIAVAAWAYSGEAVRFLAVLVVATPCPLLIAIPVAIIGSVSLAARRGVIVRDPAALEIVESCRTAIFDKTGTLTYGEPQIAAELVLPEWDKDEVLALAASLERYSKHPLATAVSRLASGRGMALHEASSISERPGEGLSGLVAGREIRITSRKELIAARSEDVARLPSEAGGLECVILIEGRLAAVYRFRDSPRGDGAPFVRHLRPMHGIDRVLIVSGDRESEVRYLAESVGIDEIYASQSPEQKVDIVRRETALAPTIFVGDGINDAPALVAATVGVAFGARSDVTSEAADFVVMDSSLAKVDEILHIGRRMRSVALQSALGGMLLSAIGMVAAAAGWLSPLAGAITQEVIDVLAVVNALRASFPPRRLVDF